MLNKYIAVYIPGTTNVDQPIDQDRQQDIAAGISGQLSKLFGGCTEYKTFGSWVDGSGNVIREPIIICKSHHNKENKAAWDLVQPIAAGLKKLLAQESITIESNYGIDFT